MRKKTNINTNNKNDSYLKGNSKYGIGCYNFSSAFITEVTTLKSHITLISILTIWFFIFVLVNFLVRFIPGYLFWWLYLPVAFLIAGRQGALLQIVHEGAHYLILRNRYWNHCCGNWLAAYPVGLTIEGYSKGHFQHHANTNTVNDLPTDLEKYAVARFGDGRLFRAFLFDILGLTALRSFLGHSGNSIQVSTLKNEASIIKKLKDRMGQGLTQLFILTVFFQFDFGMYCLLWVIPLISFNMVLLRIRGIAEHGLPTQLEKIILSSDQGKLMTRTILLNNGTWNEKILNFLERILIGSLNSNFHHEHHILPTVPFYNLPKLHAWIYSELSRNYPLSYAKSYRHAFQMGAILRKAHVS